MDHSATVRYSFELGLALTGNNSGVVGHRCGRAVAVLHRGRWGTSGSGSSPAAQGALRTCTRKEGAVRSSAHEERQRSETEERRWPYRWMKGNGVRRKGNGGPFIGACTESGWDGTGWQLALGQHERACTGTECSGGGHRQELVSRRRGK
jgi:hypothetical protein